MSVIIEDENKKNITHESGDVIIETVEDSSESEESVNDKNNGSEESSESENDKNTGSEESSESSESKDDKDNDSSEDSEDDKDELKWKKFARQHENEKKKALADNEKLSKEVETLKNELSTLKRSYELKDVITELGLNDQQAGFLAGETKEELLESGRKLLEAFGGVKNSTNKLTYPQGVQKSDDTSRYTKVTKENAWEDYQRRKNSN